MTTVAFNGKTFQVPATGEDNWGGSTKVDGLLIELAAASLQKSGGLFTLSSDVDWGPTAGHVATYYKSHSASIAQSGVVRLARADVIAFRNQADNADLPLGVDSSNRLTFNGVPFVSSSGIVPTSAGGTGQDLSAATGVVAVAAGVVSARTIVNADINAAAAIAYSKLTLTGSVTNADLAGSIAYSKLVLTGSVTNADLAGSIAYSKLVLTGSVTNADLAGSIAYSKLVLTGSVTNADLAGSIAYSKLSLAASVKASDINSQSATVGQALTADGAGGASFTTLGAVAKNFLINGNFDFWQRGTSTTIANGATAYQADRWYGKNSLGTNGVLTFSRVAGVSDGAAFGAKLQITTAPTAAQANGCELYQTLENSDSLLLYNQTASFTVKVKSFGNVNQVGIQFFYATSETKVTTAIGAEQLVTVNTSAFTQCTISGQALGTSMTASGVVGVRIRITGVSTGNTYDLNNGFVVEQAVVNLGASAASFSRAGGSTEGEMSLCQRFYEKTFPVGTAPAQNSGTNTGAIEFVGLVANGLHTTNWMFAVVKRATPTVTTYSTNAANANWSLNGNTPTAAVQNVGPDLTSIRASTAVTVGSSYSIHATADAEI